VTEFHSDPLTNRRTGEESEVAPYLPQLLPVGRSKMPCSAFNSTTRPRNLRRLTLIGTMLVILVPAISHAQSVTFGPGSEGIRLTVEKLIRRDAFFPEAMSVHLIVENLDAKPAEQLTIHCRAVDVDGFIAITRVGCFLLLLLACPTRCMAILALLPSGYPPAKVFRVMMKLWSLGKSCYTEATV
jgi:hypothetical protein